MKSRDSSLETFKNNNTNVTIACNVYVNISHGNVYGFQFFVVHPIM